MGYKTFVSMSIAIIGGEKISSVIAQGLALAGHDIYIGLRDHETISFDFLVDEFENIKVRTIEEAAEAADIIIMAARPENVREASYLLDDVRKKVIVDISMMNYMQTSAYLNTLSAIKAITGSASIVKCFNAAGFESMDKKSSDNSINMFVAGDNRKAKEVARLLSRDLGFADCHDFGSSDSIPLLDEMAMCYHNLNLKQQQPQGERIAIRITKR